MGGLRWFSRICKDSGDFVKRFVRALLKSDTVADMAVLPWFPRYYRGNGYKFYGVTRYWVQNMQESRGDGDQCHTIRIQAW